MQNIASPDMTQREKEILALLANFHNYGEMSSILGISLKTVNRHIENIKKKTDIHRKDLLIKYALEHGYGRKEKVLAWKLYC